MHLFPMHPKFLTCGLVVILLNAAVLAQSNSSKEVTFTSDSSSSSIAFSLDATMHTVHGSFVLKKGTVSITPGMNKINGEIALDATSAKTGISARDSKMHKDVLESGRFQEITFIPDRIDGIVAMHGTSNVQVHGIFTIHGTQHEMTVPTEVEISPEHWQATSHFAVPYVAWA